MTPRRILLGCGGLFVLVVVFVLGVALASNVHISFGSQPTSDPPSIQNRPPVGTTPLPITGNTTPVVAVVTPTTGNTTPVVAVVTPTTPPSGGGPTNGTDGQDFPGTATGPAIVEWYGDVSCGTFELPAGQTFTWNRVSGGHYWDYRTQADVDAVWGEHVTLFNNKPFNQQHNCQVGAQPS